tara:strand:+ start:53 stop:640 length:588 start_codon:yes stop_codon:yes gene_type:complete
MSEYRLARVFPTLIFNIDCSELISEVVDILETIEWKNKNHNDSSKDFFILSKHLELSKKFDDKVNICLSELEYAIPFKMASSWFTRTKPNQSVMEHKHTNSVWSSVFYFQDNVSNIVFRKRELPMIDVKFSNHNPSTIPYGVCESAADKGSMVVFPSDLYHSTNTNKTDTYRYSLAMNFMPDGMCYDNDSSYYYQ